MGCGRKGRPGTAQRPAIDFTTAEKLGNKPVKAGPRRHFKWRETRMALCSRLVSLQRCFCHLNLQSLQSVCVMCGKMFTGLRKAIQILWTKRIGNNPLPSLPLLARVCTL